MEIFGEVKTIIFRSEDTGYTVLDVRCDEGTFTAVGIFPPISEGQNVKCEGKFQNKAAYGNQFVVEKAWVSAPSRLEGIRKFLGSGLITGLGPVTADAIVAMYGVDTLDAMKKPIALAKVRGISLKKATDFGLQYMKLESMQETIMFLQNLGISINLSLKIFREYGSETINKVEANPYNLVNDIDGVGFLTADRIAQSMGVAKDSNYRIQAALVYVLDDASITAGNNYLPEKELLTKAISILNIDSDDIEQRVRDNIDEMIILGNLVKYSLEDYDAILTKKTYLIEKGIARKLLQLQNEQIDLRLDVDDEIAYYEKKEGFKFHELQAEAIKSSIANGVHIVTGGPGTGKTTIIKCMLRFFENCKFKVALCAPTGRAAKRMSEATGKEAKTIHRLLELDWTEGVSHFKYDYTNPLPYQVVIVDEVSMVDEMIFNALLTALDHGTRLILVGDKDQLASVGAGNVLHDLIACGKISVSCLTQIYRQSERSKIVPNAHAINNGKMPDLDNNSDDFFFEETESAEQIYQKTLGLVIKRLPKYLKTDPTNIQVLCPMKRGIAGTYNLNKELQHALNPPGMKNEIKHGDTIFREGDKVMQICNDYQKDWWQNTEFRSNAGTGVFNGDIGTIVEVEPRSRVLTIEFEDGRVAKYMNDDLDNIVLAYACTIHKSQGSEFDAVVIALESNYMMQTRNLLYTAVTRAKKLVVIVGSKQTIRRMISKSETLKRYSLLQEFIDKEAKEKYGF